ncbi:MAG: His-Xaa-Ser system radical SAM maturase HxsB [Deltaproteobacteria bacterium]|nr:His-Xaa-Ser system radical SAM maturase HxsB [Deltaproteobacteria bacterium]
MKLPARSLPATAPYFRFRKLEDDVFLVTNDIGRYAFLAEDELQDLLDGEIVHGHERFAELAEKGFVQGGMSADEQVRIIARRNSHLFTGTNLHIMIVTLRCDHRCVYCHASRAPMGTRGVDMKPETADKVLERAFETPARQVTIEFQGGEPLVNLRVIKRVVENAWKLAEEKDKELVLTLVSNLSMLDRETADYLADNGVFVCTSLDGPKELHDMNRPLPGGSSHDSVLAGMEVMNDAYRKRDLDPRMYKVNALLTVTRASLDRPEEIVDEYVRLGLNTLHARPLNPFGMASRAAGISYDADEYLAFYKRVLARVMEHALNGVDIQERTAALHLTKILTDREPNYMELRSPCGAGLGQLAYDFDGSVYTCDEGRMLARTGDDLFKVGHVQDDEYRDLAGSPVVKALAAASCVEALPGCADCAYALFCGVCPVYNYAQQGELVARQPENQRCKIQMGVLDELFSRLQNADQDTLSIFERWTRPLPGQGEGGST